MKNLITLIWWYLISKYSIHNLQKLYSKYITNDLKSLRNYQASCIFIIACAIRSIFPRIDGSRICFFDFWISYPLVGRTFATFGELAFVYQLTLVTKSFALQLECSKIYHSMTMIMSLIFIAQLFCWYGVLYQNNMMHVIEESIWMFSMAYIGLSYLYFCDLIKNIHVKTYFLLAFIGACIYTMFMLFVDIPMYYERDQNKYKIILSDPSLYVKFKIISQRSLYESVKDMASCQQISKSYDVWKDEIPWMSGYFIGATWLSISLIHYQNLNIN